MCSFFGHNLYERTKTTIFTGFVSRCRIVHVLCTSARDCCQFADRVQFAVYNIHLLEFQ
jgi:hypothetical protein